MDIGFFGDIKVSKDTGDWFLIDIWNKDKEEIESYPEEYWIKCNNKYGDVGMYWVHANMFSMLSLKYSPFQVYYGHQPLEDIEINICDYLAYRLTESQFKEH